MALDLRRLPTNVQHLTATERDKFVRVSTASALTLGLTDGILDVRPTTAYLLTHHPGRCLANCLFCSLAKTSRSRADLLSRVSWPPFRLDEVLESLAKKRNRVRRVCIQAMNYPGWTDDILAIVCEVLSRISIDMSVSCQPVDLDTLHKLHHAGVDRISIPVDAATPRLFSMVKGPVAGGPYTWQSHMGALRQAVSVFGLGQVTTHVIVGLGETDRDMLGFIQEMVDQGICPALFAFTPIAGTRLEKNPPPSLLRYRVVQTARFLLVNRLVRVGEMRFDESGALVDFGIPREELFQVIRSGSPFQTSGCPDCNRPFYNERPSGPIYNFPRPLTLSEIEEAERTLERAYHG